jgi:hypothetical protein
MTINPTYGVWLLLGLLITGSVVAENSADDVTVVSPPLIAIIIDDLGNQRAKGERVIALPGPVACAVIPHTAYSTYLAEEAYAAGKEVLLHLPMQPIEMERIAGPDQIRLDTDRSNLRRILNTDLDDVPHTVGINNHMGSLITRHPGHMEWLMDELKTRGDLFFIDSYTTASSVAYEMAIEKSVPTARRTVFLDTDITAENVAKEFERLKHTARKQGFAIAIGHPYLVTLDYLEKALPLLAEQGFQLVPVSRIVELGSSAREKSKESSVAVPHIDALSLLSGKADAS